MKTLIAPLLIATGVNWMLGFKTLQEHGFKEFMKAFAFIEGCTIPIAAGLILILEGLVR